jgi:hypothetical protein
MNAGDKLSMPIPQNFHSSIFVTKGELSTDGYEIPEQHLVWFNEENQNIEISAMRNSEFLLMAGEPIEEPMASYGPFVMNNRAEIIEAIHDYEAGKYGNIAQ